MKPSLDHYQGVSRIMSNQAVWIGVDLGQTCSTLCVVDEGGVPLHEVECATNVDQLQAAMSAFDPSAIALIAVEAGTQSHIVRQLRGRGYPVVIFEARKASKFLSIRRSKTDSGDARGLADLGRLGRDTVSQVYLKSVECEQLRFRLVTRQRLVRMRVLSRNTVRSRLSFQGRLIKQSRSFPKFKRDVTDQLRALAREEGLDLGPDVLPLLEILERLDRHIKALDRELEKSATDLPVTRRLMEVPGVGPICALSFYSAIGDPHRFGRSSDIGAYLGLAPRRFQSGSTSRTLGISKTGSKMTRAHLFTAAGTFRRSAPDGPLRRWALALRERAGARRSSVALARKLAIIMLTMWKNGTAFEHQPPAREPVPEIVI